MLSGHILSIAVGSWRSVCTYQSSYYIQGRAINDHLRGLKITQNNWALNLTAFQTLHVIKVLVPQLAFVISASFQEFPSEFQDRWWGQEIVFIAKHSRTHVLPNSMGWEEREGKESWETERRNFKKK